MAIDTIKSTAVLDGAIATADIADDAVTSDKLDTNISVDGNLGLGTSVSTRKLNVNASSYGHMLLDTADASHGIQILGQANAQANSGFDIQYAASTGMKIRTLAVQPLSLQTSASAGSPSDNLHIHTNGVVSIPNGIELGSGVDATAANVLEDYEEGTWTPTIGGSGATYTNQQGLYTKVGRYVCAAFDITVNVRNSGSTNELHGFPFTANTGVSPAMGVYSGHISFYSGVSQNLYSLDMYIINGQTYAYFTGHTTASGNIGNSLAVWQNGTRILGTVHYFAN